MFLSTSAFKVPRSYIRTVKENERFRFLGVLDGLYVF